MTFNKNRLYTRIDRLLNDYKQEKQERQDLTTEQVEYEKSKAELSFQPNTEKSKQSYQVLKSSFQKNQKQETTEGTKDFLLAQEGVLAQNSKFQSNEEPLRQGSKIQPVEEDDSEHEVQIDLNPQKGEVSYFGMTPAARNRAYCLELQTPLDHLKVETAPQVLENDGATNMESSQMRMEPYEQPLSKHSSVDFQRKFLVNRFQSESEFGSRAGASEQENPVKLCEQSESHLQSIHPRAFHQNNRSENFKFKPFSPQGSFRSAGLSGLGNAIPKTKSSVLMKSEGSANESTPM